MQITSKAYTRFFAGLFFALLLVSTARANTVTGSIWEDDPTGAGDATPANVPGTTPNVTFTATTPLDFQSGSLYTIGEFINSQEALIGLRKKTLRSHASVTASSLTNKKFGLLYDKIINEIKITQNTPWQKEIPIMIQGYFEDMDLILRKLKEKATKDAQLCYRNS